MKLKPRHRWFASTDKDACEGWYGPHKTIEAAFNDCQDQELPDQSFPIYVAQGRKMTKADLEEEEMEDVDFEWLVDTKEVFEIRLLKRNDEIRECQ